MSNPTQRGEVHDLQRMRFLAVPDEYRVTRSPRVLRKIFRRLPAVLAELTEDEVRIIWSIVNLGYYRLMKKEENGRNPRTAPRS